MLTQYISTKYSDFVLFAKEKFENTKGVIRSHNSKDRQYYCLTTSRQTKFDKILHRKLNIEQHKSH